MGRVEQNVSKEQNRKHLNRSKLNRTWILFNLLLKCFNSMIFDHLKMYIIRYEALGSTTNYKSKLEKAELHEGYLARHMSLITENCQMLQAWFYSHESSIISLLRSPLSAFEQIITALRISEDQTKSVLLFLVVLHYCNS